MIEHEYRKLFKLSYIEFLSEPAHVVTTAMTIERMRSDKLEKELKHGNR